jgi:hypothetical protein
MDGQKEPENQKCKDDFFHFYIHTTK